MNLILNGIEAMKDANGELTITSKRTADGQLLVSVSDSGIGLPVGEVDRIFEGLLHHQRAGHRHGTVHQSEDYRVSRRLFVGLCQYGTGRDISVHTAHRRGGVLTIGRVTLGSPRCSCSSGGKTHCGHGLNPTNEPLGKGTLGEGNELLALNHADRTARQHASQVCPLIYQHHFRPEDEHSAIRVKRHAAMPRTRGFWSVQI
jgi:hypothetical protein